MAPSPDKPRKPRNKGQAALRFVVEPTPEHQSIYNEIRDDEARHSQRQSLRQHVDSQGHLLPCDPRDPRAPSTSRSATNDSQGSLSPASTTDLPDHLNTPTAESAAGSARRPRGRRSGPLEAEKKFKTFIKRKLKLVCSYCKQKKITCDHFDLSRLEEGYQASRRAAAALSPLNNAPSHGVSPNTMLIGLESNTNPLELVDDIDDFLETAQPPNARQHELLQLVTGFDVGSVSLGLGTLPISMGHSYNPGLDTPAPPPPLSEPFPIGSVMTAYPNRWQCEYSNAGGSTRTGSSSTRSEVCTWTGPHRDLEHHFISEHHAFQDATYWCQCEVCDGWNHGWDPPETCTQPDCSPYGGGSWRRWYYGCALETAVASTPALTTQSGESEGGYSFEPHQGPAGNAPSASGQNGQNGQNSASDMWSGYGMGYYFHHTNAQGRGGGGSGSSSGSSGSSGGGGDGESCYDDACLVTLSRYPIPLISLSPIRRTQQCVDHDLGVASAPWRSLFSDCSPFSGGVLSGHYRRRTAQLCFRILCVLAFSMLVAMAFGPDLIAISSSAREGPMNHRCAPHTAMSHIPPLAVAFLLGGFAATWLFRWWTSSHHLALHSPYHPRSSYQSQHPRLYTISAPAAPI